MYTTQLKFWQVDAFSPVPFKGNPAAVFIVNETLTNDLMQQIAMEMNLAETAFVLLREGMNPLLRWFTPVLEIDLCGHGTIAAAQVYFNECAPKYEEVVFDTQFVGPLKVIKDQGGYVMEFPSRPGAQRELSEVPEIIFDALSEVKPTEVYKSRDLMLVYEDEAIVRGMSPDLNALMKTDDCIIVTAKSNGRPYDFISRVFSPQDGIPEDPVTGSTHCTLAPYWSARLGKQELIAYQASLRGGELRLCVTEDMVRIWGEAKTVIQGELIL